MRAVIERGLEIWEHMARNVAFGDAQIDTEWTEESFVTKFILNKNNTSIIVVGDETLYDEEHTFIVTRDEALNIDMVESDVHSKRPIRKDRYPIFQYIDGVKETMGSYETKLEAYHMERQLVINSLDNELLAYKMGGVGLPVIPVTEGMLKAKGRSPFTLPTRDMIEDTKDMIMIGPVFDKSSGKTLSIPEGTIISTVDMLRTYFDNDDIQYELIGATKVQL